MKLLVSVHDAVTGFVRDYYALLCANTPILLALIAIGVVVPLDFAHVAATYAIGFAVVVLYSRYQARREALAAVEATALAAPAAQLEGGYRDPQVVPDVRELVPAHQKQRHHVRPPQAKARIRSDAN